MVPSNVTLVTAQAVHRARIKAPKNAVFAKARALSTPIIEPALSISSSASSIRAGAYEAVKLKALGTFQLILGFLNKSYQIRLTISKDSPASPRHSPKGSSSKVTMGDWRCRRARFAEWSKRWEVCSAISPQKAQTEAWSFFTRME